MQSRRFSTLRHEVDDLADRLRRTLDTIEFQRAQPPVASPPQWHAHNPWAPLFPGNSVALQTPTSIGFAPSSHQYFSGLQDTLLTQVQQVQHRLHEIESDFLPLSPLADCPEQIQPMLPQQHCTTPPMRRLPSQQTPPPQEIPLQQARPKPWQTASWLPQQAGRPLPHGPGLRPVGFPVEEPQTPPSRGETMTVSGRPMEPTRTANKPELRRCRFGAKCRYKHLYCPFQHPELIEARPLGQPNQLNHLNRNGKRGNSRWESDR